MADLERDGRANIQALGRASAILGLFNVDRDELVTAEVADALGLNRTTTHRYLTSMTAIGLLSPGRRPSSYAVGPLATRLGALAIGATPALSIASRHLQALSDDLAAAVTLSLWASTGAMVVQVAEPRTPGAVLTVRPGTVLSISSAQGAVFGAFLDDEIVHVSARREQLSDARRAVFDAAVAELRESGTCVIRGDRGVVAVAAPIFDDRRLRAAMAVVSLAGSTTEGALPTRIRRLREVSQRISHKLGAARTDPHIVDPRPTATAG